MNFKKLSYFYTLRNRPYGFILGEVVYRLVKFVTLLLEEEVLLIN